MARLLYSAICSLDGYVEDAAGGFGWAAPDDEVHAFVNDLERPVGTYLYGRRMYETMRFWESVELASLSPVARDYAELWRAADKVVWSTTLGEPSTARTRVERSFDPAAVRALKEAAPADLSVGGPGLAAHALGAGLVDELQLLLVPVVVRAGKPALPPGLPLRLALRDERRFTSGAVHLRYEVEATG